MSVIVGPTVAARLHRAKRPILCERGPARRPERRRGPAAEAGLLVDVLDVVPTVLAEMPRSSAIPWLNSPRTSRGGLQLALGQAGRQLACRCRTQWPAAASTASTASGRAGPRRRRPARGDVLGVVWPPSSAAWGLPLCPALEGSPGHRGRRRSRQPSSSHKSTQTRSSSLDRKDVRTLWTRVLSLLSAHSLRRYSRSGRNPRPSSLPGSSLSSSCPRPPPPDADGFGEYAPGGKADFRTAPLAGSQPRLPPRSATPPVDQCSHGRERTLAA